ncbi:MAG TPA: hypothetical protein VGP69_02220, partial [Gaiellaceae bacterium]|nr:hypothetical protein [Gaiellaceae bacterium]
MGSIVLIRGPHVGDPVLELLNRLGIGAISFALLTFGAGWAGWLYPAAYLPVFAATALVGASRFAGWARAAP